MYTQAFVYSYFLLGVVYLGSFLKKNKVKNGDIWARQGIMGSDILFLTNLADLCVSYVFRIFVCLLVVYLESLLKKKTR